MTKQWFLLVHLVMWPVLMLKLEYAREIIILISPEVINSGEKHLYSLLIHHSKCHFWHWSRVMSFISQCKQSDFFPALSSVIYLLAWAVSLISRCDLFTDMDSMKILLVFWCGQCNLSLTVDCVIYD